MYFVVGIQLMYHLVGINVPFGGNKCTIWWDVDNFFAP